MRLGLVREARAAYEEAKSATGSPDGSNLSLVSLALRTALALDGPVGLEREIEALGLAKSDEPNVLFELAEAELFAGNARAAQGYVSRALASPKLRADDLAKAWYARTGNSNLLIAAAAEHATGDEAGAQRHVDAAARLIARMSAAGVKRHGLLVLEAEVAALRGDRDAAMRSLTAAVDLGLRYAWPIEHSPSFAALRDRREFSALLEKMAARNANDLAAVIEITQRRLAAQ